VLPTYHDTKIYVNKINEFCHKFVTKIKLIIENMLLMIN
jgi:hypothetical protein